MAIDPLMNDILDGYVYRATLQLRTPLPALLADGKTSNSGREPINEFGDTHGIWMPKARSWHELGIDMDEIDESQSASDIGYVDRVPYLNFLISLKLITGDAERTIDQRMETIKSVVRQPEFSGYCRKHGGQGKLIDKLLPRIISTIPKINSITVDILWKSRIRSVAKISSISDGKLLALPGIGPKKVEAIRAFCTSFIEDREAERVISW